MFVHLCCGSTVEPKKYLIFLIMENKIFTLSDLQKEGKHIAKLAANRNIRTKVVAEKKKSLHANGQAIPAVIVKATSAIEQGYAVLDFETNASVMPEQAAEYVVIVDGAHRYQAHLELLKDSKANYAGEFYFIYPLNEDQKVGQLLAEINTCTTPWKGGDYAIGASIMVDEDLPVLSFITELAKKGCSLRAASEMATLTDTITKGVIVKAMNGKIDDSLKFTDNLEYGKRLYYLAAEKFGEEFLKTRIFPDWVLKVLNATPASTPRIDTIEKIASFISNLSKDDAEEIVKMRGCRGGETKEALVNKRLDELFQAEVQ